MERETGRSRVIIEGVAPEIDGGRFPIKRIAGEQVIVEADVFTDGHDQISCMVLYRQTSDPEWSALPADDRFARMARRQRPQERRLKTGANRPDPAIDGVPKTGFFLT